MNVPPDTAHPGLTTLVVPTCGEPSLPALLAALATQTVAVESPIIVVDDRPGPAEPLLLGDTELQVRVLRSGGAGLAAARNLGWRAAHTPWVSFIDDDVVPTPDWYVALLEDIDALPVELMGSQGQVPVPPGDRRWGEDEHGLPASGAVWSCADLTLRRAALAAVGGFDERFRHGYLEDVDLALRITQRLGGIEIGSRVIAHPTSPVDFWASVRAQADNADEMLMLRLHGPQWRRAAGAPAPRRWLHLGITGSGAAAVAAALAGRPRIARLAGALWFAGTAEFAVRRLRPSSHQGDGMARTVLTSVVIPFAASWHTLVGLWRWRAVAPWRGLPDLVVFDRDGLLIQGAEGTDAVALLRARGVPVAMVDAASTPGTVLEACQHAAADPERTVVIGDRASDVEAAHAAGAVGIFVPTDESRPGPRTTAPLVASTLAEAVELALKPSALWSSGDER